MHRADYHQVLYKETIRLGAKLRLGCDILDVDCEIPCATTAPGDTIYADVIIGADGNYLDRKWFVHRNTC